MADQPNDAGSSRLFSRTQKILAGIVVLVLAAASAYYFFGLPAKSSSAATVKSSITVFADDRTQGSPNAPITMLEYGAPICPHCAHFDMEVMPLIKKNYIDSGKVYYIFRVFPLSPIDGAVEGIARRCLPKDQYFGFIDFMFRHQPQWDPDGSQIADVHAALLQMAHVYGIAPEQADQCMTNKDEQDRINRVAQDGETKYNIQGTPTFVINGDVVQVEDATWPALKARFDALLANKG